LFLVPRYLKIITFANDVLAVIMVRFCRALCSWERKAVKKVLELGTQPPVKSYDGPVMIGYGLDDFLYPIPVLNSVLFISGRAKIVITRNL